MEPGTQTRKKNVRLRGCRTFAFMIRTKGSYNWIVMALPPYMM